MKAYLILEGVAMFRFCRLLMFFESNSSKKRCSLKDAISFLIISFFYFGSIQAENSFVVLIPSYNNQRYYQRNLDSVFSQKYEHFRVIYVDDYSPDGTGLLVESYIKRNGQEDRVTLVQNEYRVGALPNVYKSVWSCSPEEIIVILDGDDWFPHDQVLNKLDQVYSDPNVWVTYGQFVYYPCGSPGWAAQVPEEVIHSNSFREYSWVTTHLRTFYAGLFQKIRMQDLFYQGRFFTMAGDLAYTFPILEMAGIHSRFIPEVLYVYNFETQMNDIKVNEALQTELGLATRRKPKYLPIDRPYD
jgi:glycosyltransferase involved in cell wall biosynthesis